MKEKRRRIWIDRFQTILFLRIVLYFVIYQFAVWSVFLIGQSMSEMLGKVFGSGVGTTIFWCSVAVVVLFGALFICDAIRLTHKFVGPIYRFRRTIKAITAGEKVDLMRLRNGDFLQELKDEFNDMLVALEQRGAGVLQKREPEKPVEAQEQRREAISA
jgi:hypothetical protein